MNNPNLTPLFFALWIIDALISYDHTGLLYALWLIFDADCFTLHFYTKRAGAPKNQPA